MPSVSIPSSPALSLSLYLKKTKYSFTPCTGSHVTNIFDIALLSNCTICSVADKLLGEGFSSIKVVIVLGFAATSRLSTSPYLFVSCITAVIVYSESFFSSIETTRKICNSIEEFSIAQTLFGKGSEEKEEERVIVVPETLWIDLDSTEPSDKTTESVAKFSDVKSLLFASSTTIAVVFIVVFVIGSTYVVLETDFIRPPLLTPALNESAMAIIVAGLTITPASSVVVKLTVSDSFKFEYKNHLPNLFAWPLDVQAKAFKVFLVLPNLFLASNAFGFVSPGTANDLISSVVTSSKSISCVSLSK